jgi:hypothetical protein
MASSNQDKEEQRATYLTLISIFLSLVGLFSLRDRRGRESKLEPFDFALLGLATFRAGRLAAYDKVTEPLRAPFTETKPDESGAGESTDPKGKGMQRAIGELISCPTCIGTWIAAFLVYGLRLAPGPTRLLITILASTGLAELLNGLAETLSWAGRVARKEVGS